MEFPGLYDYWIVVVLMMVGLYIVIARRNLVRKWSALNFPDFSVHLLHAMSKVEGGTAPIITRAEAIQIAAC